MKKAYKLLGSRCTNTHVTRRAELTQIQEQKVPSLSYARVRSRKQLGRISSHEGFSMYGKKKAKQNKQEQQKGIISVNSLRFLFPFSFNALDKPQEEGKRCGVNICSLELDKALHRLCGLCVSSCARGCYLCFYGLDSSESGL